MEHKKSIELDKLHTDVGIKKLSQQGPLRQGDILTSISIVNQSCKHRLLINKFGLIFSLRFPYLNNQSIIDIVDMADYGSTISLTVKRDGLTHVLSAPFLPRNAQKWMKRSTFLTLEPKRARYMLVAGCIFMEHDIEMTEDYTNTSAFDRDVRVAHIIPGSMIANHGSVEIDSHVVSINKKHVFCLEDLYAIFKSFNKKDCCKMCFSNDTYFEAYVSKIREDDTRLSDLFSIPQWNQICIPTGLSR